MKREKFCLSGLLLALVSLSLSCGRIAYQPALAFGPSEVRWVDATLARMTLEEKIGQMITCRYTGRFFNRDSDYIRELESLIVERKIGGLILFRGEVYETAFLTNAVQEMARIPLLIAADFERGAGSQVTGTTLLPPLMAVGATWSEEQAYLMGKLTALEGRALGIHMTYAPVVDVNINPENPIINVRSFGEDPEQVGRMAAAFIRGCQENGLIATAKHFPGHGDTDLDSHSVLPTIWGDRERLEQVELSPFRKAVEAGVQAIMSAHLHLPALDPSPDLPATLSPRIMSGLLRDELGFQGLIVTDAMDMGGVTTLYSPGEAALRAVQAGVDVLLLPPEPDEVISALIGAVREGALSEGRINTSVRRILEAKARVGLHRRRFVDVDRLNERIATRENLRLAAGMFEKSLTLIRNEGQVLPLSGEEQRIAVFALSSDPGGYFEGRPLVSALEKKWANLVSFYADAYTGEEYLKEGLGAACDADVWVFALFSSLRAWKGSVGLAEKHVQLVREAAKGERPVVVVSFGSPYFLGHFPDVDAYLCAYGQDPPAQEAAAKALCGDIDVTGRLPVSLPGLYPPGHGLVLHKRQNSGSSHR